MPCLDDGCAECSLPLGVQHLSAPTVCIQAGFIWLNACPERQCTCCSRGPVHCLALFYRKCFLQGPFCCESSSIHPGGTFGKCRPLSVERISVRPVLLLFSTASFFQLQVHLAIEAALVVMLVVGLLQRSYRPGAPVAERLTEKVGVSRVVRSHLITPLPLLLANKIHVSPRLARRRASRGEGGRLCV